jgi:hypothetical protein
MILRLLIEGYIELALTSIINLQNINWTSASNYISDIYAIAVLAFVICFPLMMTYVLSRKTIDELKDKQNQLSLGTAYQDLRLGRRSALLYNAIQMYRRLLVALVITMLKGQPCFQI